MSLTEESNDNSKISQLVRTLVPRGEFDPSKEYIDVRKYYIALYKYKRGRKRRSNDKEYNFDIFKEFYNAEVGTYFKSLDDKIIGLIDQNNNLKISTIKGRGNYDVNCYILGASKFDSIRLLMYHNGLIKAYVQGMATEEEINEVISKLGYLYQTDVNYVLDDLGFETGKRRRG